MLTAMFEMIAKNCKDYQLLFAVEEIAVIVKWGSWCLMQ